MDVGDRDHLGQLRCSVSIDFDPVGIIFRKILHQAGGLRVHRRAAKVLIIGAGGVGLGVEFFEASRGARERLRLHH